MNDTVLVTGGAGYIGSHACKALARAGFRPIAYDNLTYGHTEAVKIVFDPAVTVMRDSSLRFAALWSPVLGSAPAVPIPPGLWRSTFGVKLRRVPFPSVK